MNIHTLEWAGNRGAPAIDELVHERRVHSAIYTDPAIFELELRRIFGRAWLLIGHTSEVPEHGDYRLRKMGRASVIMVRGDDGKVRVLMNRCRHRGSQVCESESGRNKVFRCWYHGWTYDNTGKLVVVSGPAGYGADFHREDMALTPAPRVDEYRGFVFASLSPEGPSLDENLGRAKAIIDLLVDASPTGEIFVDGGAHKTVYRGNWKLVGMDGYHPNFVHASVVQAWKRNAESGLGATHREDPFVDEARTVTRDLGNGHVMLDFRAHRIAHYDAHCAFMRKIPGGDAYIADMHRAYGDQRARLLISLSGDPHVGVFPNMQLIHNQVRIVNPLRVDETEVVMIAVRLGGVSDEMNAARLRTHESFYGPAGAGSPDDAEIFERVQRGLTAEIEPWVELSRGIEREVVDADGSIVGRITDEVTQRGQIRRWRELMQP
jgi:phenylpropionate dioxygenase-like ring-hydroxylating dioxygenase large terminal subunit